MKLISKHIVLWGLVLLNLVSFAQSPKLTASAPSAVANGQQFRVTYSFNQQGSNFKGPSFKDFNYLTGPNQSSSTSMQIMNGNVTQSVSYTYTYILQAAKEGTFEIPGASIEFNGTTYKSNGLSINVVKGNAPQTQQYSQQQPNNRQSQTTASDDVNSKDIYIRAIPDKTNPYQGEQIIVTYKMYTSVGVAQYGINKLPSFNGFWNVDLLKEAAAKAKQYRETIDGKQYTVVEIRKIALFPQKSGNLTIDPLEVEAVVQVQSRRKSSGDFFDDFFNNSFFGSVQNVKKTLKSNMVSLSVKPLPANKPIDFNGFSGNLNFKATLDKTDIKANEALNLKLTVSGTGNLKLIDKLNIEFPPDFETYDPKLVDNISTTAAGVSGSRTFEYLVIPRKEGVFKLKPITFSYFNLASKSFITLSSPEYTIKVAKGAPGQGSATTLTTSKEDIKYIGSDIQFIKTNSFALKQDSSIFFGSTLYFILMFLPLLLFVAFVITYRNMLKQRRNVALMKNKKANKVARKRLVLAQRYLTENKRELFFEELSKAIWGYLSDKFTIPLSQLSMENVQEVLQQRNVNEQMIFQLIDLLNSCEYSRFAPDASSLSLEQPYNEALSLIRNLESQI
ncbi:MAG: BatD family protein [Bacteroidota bacterium]